jgi:iron complex outermembrane receptor protein
MIAAGAVAQVSIDTVQLNSVEILRPVIIRDQSHMPLTDLKYQSGKRLSDVLGEISSVYIKSYGSGQLASITIRGTTAAQTEIQWNGIRLNQPTLGQIDLSLLTMGMQDEFGMASYSGNLSIGGVVAVNNIAKFCNCLSAEGTLRYGSFKSFQSYAGMQYGHKRMSGATKISYLSSANNFKYRNDYKQGKPYEVQQNAQTKLFSFIQQMNAKIDTYNQVSVILWLNEADRQIAPIVSKPDSKESQADESIRAMAMWKAKYESYTRGNLQMGLTSAYMNESLLYVNPEAKMNALTRTNVVRNIFNAAYSYKRLEVYGAINYDYEQANVASYQDKKVRHITGVQVNAHYIFNNSITLALGLRQDLLNTQASPFSPSLGLGYTKTFESKHFISVSTHAARAFRFPTFNDLYWMPGGNANLKTEKSWKGDVNFIYVYNSLLTFSASGYCSYVNDWIQWVPQGADWSAINYKRVLSRGFETAINATNTNVIGKKFKVDVNASYSFTKTTNLDAASAFDQSKGKQLIYVPLHSIAAGLQLQYRRFYIRATGNYFSQLFISTDNSQYLDGYFICNVEVGKDFELKGQEVGLSFRVNNVANANYQSVAQRPMPGRGFEGILRFKFSK